MDDAADRWHGSGNFQDTRLYLIHISDVARHESDVSSTGFGTSQEIFKLVFVAVASRQQHDISSSAFHHPLGDGSAKATRPSHYDVRTGRIKNPTRLGMRDL